MTIKTLEYIHALLIEKEQQTNEVYKNSRKLQHEKADVERNIGIRAKDIEKIQFCGLWHIRFRAFGTDFYYWKANSDDTCHLKESPWDWD